jgi:type II secretion system protein L
MKPIQLAFLQAGDAPWRVLTLAGAPARTPRRILVVPGAGVRATMVDAMGRTEPQARAAALAGLAQDLAATPDTTECVLGPVRNGRRLAFIAAKADIASWSAEAAAQGFTPDVMIPDFALLPEPAAGAASIARRGDWLVRTDTGGFACQDDILPLLTGELHPREHDFEPQAVAAIKDGALATLPQFTANVRQRAPKNDAKPFVHAALAAGVALTIAAAIPWIDAMRSDAATRDLRKQTEAVARAALPEAQRIVNPLAQLREAALPRARGQTALDMAASVFEGLGKSPGVEITRIELDADGAVHASLAIPSAALMQPLRDHLAGDQLHITETPGESQPNNLPVTLTVKAAP